MYSNPVGVTVFATTGTLAATGGAQAMPWIWIVLGSFALASAAAAVSRSTPKTQA